ncbi:MAG: DUF4846 domain-containing protein [Prevotellaceae bacterium]|jgi:hypothetical protein|nr:DUF4846 domain-containing protein [Prevotellaceae bacterium]
MKKAQSLAMLFAILYTIALQLTACAQDNKLINKSGTTVQTRILAPNGFVREKAELNSFAAYLRNLTLKPHGSDVKFHNGHSKGKSWVYSAVVDMEIGTRDLQQCADAIIRLRAEYLYKQKRYNAITFNFTNGFKAAYSEWMNGKRVSVKGNTVKWVQLAKISNTYADFRSYLDVVFTYAGTLSLSKELKTKNILNIKAGDVFIQGGSPGHAVIVIDTATNPSTGEKLFLLAQSHMPAQDIQILNNPGEYGPWYSVNFGDILYTPEWNFKKDDLKEF